MTTTITLPTLPSTFTPGSIITYATALAAAIIGGLVTTGVTVPSGLAVDVQVIGGLASIILGGVLALGHHAVHQSTVKAALAARPDLVTAITAAGNVIASPVA